MLYICIPSRNEAPTVGLLLWKIRQVFASTPREYHLLVGDDASTDATREVLAPYAKVLPLTILRSEKHQGYARTVEFREGFIENLPVASDSVDVVISNCVINLSPDKARVFREAYRVLRPGGRLAVSDIVLTEPLPAEVAKLAASWVACLGGASTEKEYLGDMRAAGFEHIQYTRKPAGPMLTSNLQDPMWKAAMEMFGTERIQEVAGTVFSYSITAEKR